MLIDGTVSALEKLQQKRGTHLSELQEKLSEWKSLGAAEYTPQLDAEFREAIEEPFIERVIQNIQERFVHSSVVQNFSVFSMDDTAVDASDELVSLLDHYSPAVDKDDALMEWRTFSTSLDKLTSFTAQSVMVDLAERDELRTLYPNLSKLAAMGAVIPMSTVDAERGFSAVNRIKTKLRNRMKATTLQNLLTIEVEGPELKDMDYEATVKFWAQMKNRRICFA